MRHVQRVEDREPRGERPTRSTAVGAADGWRLATRRSSSGSVCGWLFRGRCVVAVVLTATAVAVSAAAQDNRALQAAAALVEQSGAPGGVCVVVGARRADLPLALAKLGNFAVHCLAPDDGTRDRLRDAFRAAGRHGLVSAVTRSGQRLPYTDNLVNVVVAEIDPGDVVDPVAVAEIKRVLTPLGVAWLHVADGEAQARELAGALRAAGLNDVTVDASGAARVCARKPWPAQIDEWSHFLHGADGNPVAQDTVVGPPRRYQWVSGPMWQRSHETDSSISTLVTARGRLFYIVDDAPISLTGQHTLPDQWSLTARDAFNGTLLWRVPIRRWGWREWKNSWFSNRPSDIPLNHQKRLVAVGDHVYVTLGYHAPVSQLDARTGDILRSYGGSERTNEILLLDGTLVLSVLVGDQLRVMAFDADTGRQLWATEKLYNGTAVDYVKWTTKRGVVKAPKLDPASNIATDGNVVALTDGPDVVCLDFATGTEKWRAGFPAAPEDANAGGIKTRGNLWVGTMIVSDGVVIHASPNQMAGFSAASGDVLWTQPKKYIGHLWYSWKDVFVISGLAWTWGADLGQGEYVSGRKTQRTLHPQSVNGYDVKTGELSKSVPLGNIFKAHHHHRCYRNKATPRYILASRRGTEFVDLEQGKHTVHNWVRGTCHVGMMPANGLQYAPPHPCACYVDEKLNGMNALAPASSSGSDVGAVPADTPRLVRGPAFGRTSGPAATAQDWPTFRCDGMRSGSVDTAVPGEPVELWRVRVGDRLTPPTAVAARVFVASVDQHDVVCLGAGDGAELWRFAAGGRIDSPPTYHNGAVLFGCADGWVYCVRAADGVLAWRFRAAPEERLIGAFGQLESAWPVHGSVLVQGDAVYCTAGRTSQLDGGIRLYGLDVATGQLRCDTTLHGPDYAAGDFEQNFRLPMGTLPDVLMGDGSSIFMRATAFDAGLARQRGAPALRAKSGLLEDSYFKRTPWTFEGRYARLVVHDKRSAYYVRQFDSLAGLDTTVFFTPASKGYLLFARNVGEDKQTWAGRVPVRIRAMALTAGSLFAAGPPDVVEANDPLGAFQRRKGGVMCAFDTTSGDRLAELTLQFPPVFNGVAAANGRLYLAEEGGSVTCFGQR